MTNSKVTRVILSFDDGRKDNIDVAEKVLKKYELKATFNITTGYLDDTIRGSERPCRNPALTINDVMELNKNELFEIAGHGQNHLNDVEDWQEGIEKLKQWLGEHWGEQGIGVASPHCGITEQSIMEKSEIIKSNNIAYVRIGLKNQNSLIQKIVSKLAILTHSNVMFYASIKKSLQVVGTSMCVYSIPVLHNLTVEQIKYAIMKAETQKLDCVFMFHSIVLSKDQYYSDLWSWDAEKFDELCKWLKREQSDKKIQVVTTIEMFK